METSYRQFLIGLYNEHLEEAAFLYEQRKALLDDSETKWTRLDEFEGRLEAHLDALLIGGELALTLCRARLKDAEAGELFALVCVICRHQEARLLAEVWRSLDFGDAEKVSAVSDALKLEMPLAWQSACEQAVSRGDDRLLPILAVVCAARRIPLSEPIAGKLLAAPQLITSQIVTALSRLPLKANVAALLDNCDQHAAKSVKAAALLVRLRNGQRATLAACYVAAQTEDWPVLALGLAGDRSAATLLRKRLKSEVVGEDAIYALGMLGDLSSVRALCDCLANEELAELVSWALFWITGAPLFDNEFVAETVDESTLFPTELAAWREHGEAPKRADGKPFGATVYRLSQDASLWHRWLSDHARDFDANVRYRRGSLYSLRSVYDCLLEPSTPHAWRRLAYEELVVRFGCEVPFEADWRVAEQRVALKHIESWVQATEAQFAAGTW